VVGVMGSGRENHEDLAVPLGRMLAEYQVHLLTGGGQGVMEAVSRGFASSTTRTGKIIGVLPASPTGAAITTSHHEGKHMALVVKFAPIFLNNEHNGAMYEVNVYNSTPIKIGYIA